MQAASDDAVDEDNFRSGDSDDDAPLMCRRPMKGKRALQPDFAAAASAAPDPVPVEREVSGACHAAAPVPPRA